MTLQYKKKCEYHEGGIMADMHPELVRFPRLCPMCHGTMEVEYDVSFDDFDGDFLEVKYEEVTDYDEELYLRFKCSCGDELSFSGDDTKVCKCGKIYRVCIELSVDKWHVGDIDWILKKREEEEEARKKHYRDLEKNNEKS
jgi:hypothetical protein